MSRLLKLAKPFKKSFKKLSNAEQELFWEVVELLKNDEILPPKCRDHALSGNFINYRELHIKPDLLLIYQKQDNGELILYCLNIGSHAELFKK